MANPNFVPSFSSDEIWRGQDTNRCISDDLDTIESNIDSIKSSINNLGDDYAAVNHTHDEYAAISDVNAVRDALGSKADAVHVHKEYAPSSHVHDEYAAKATVLELEKNIGDKADLIHSHADYATTNALNDVIKTVDGKAPLSHSHDNVYYTESEIDAKLNAKADVGHSHPVDSSFSATSVNPVQNKVINSALSEKVPVSRTINGKPLASNISLTAGDVGADTAGAAADAVASAKAYTDSKIDALVGKGASTTLDTIGEISTAIEGNQDAVKALNAAIGTKANASDLASHTSNTTVHITADERAKWNAAKTHADIAHAPSNAEPNQNAFSNIIVGNTTISADTKTDTLSLVGSNVTITPDATNDKITVGINKSNVTAALGYTPPTKDTTYAPATQSVDGLMSSGDKKKLDGVAEGANKYVLPSAGSSLGGVKTGGDVTIAGGTITVNDDSHNHVIANVDGLQSALDSKSATNHNHDKSYVSKDLQFTADNGGAEYSYLKADNKNVLTEILNYPIGVHTVYSQSGTLGNPKPAEAWRMLIHKTSSTVCWVQAYGSTGSVYTGYYDGANGWRGWKCLWDNDPDPLWTGASYMHSPGGKPQVVTPSKKLSECQHGWLLMWADYDPGSGVSDIDLVTTMIPKTNPSGGKWGGKAFLCDVPRYVGSDPDNTATEKRIIKVIYVHDDCIKGSFQNASGDRNDVCLRAIYEY